MQTSLKMRMIDPLGINDPLLDANTRVQRYWNVDGLHEIAMAILFLLTALSVWAGESATLSKFWKGAAAVALPIFLIVGISVEGSVVQAIRRRLTFPRTGFVTFRKPSAKRRRVGVTVAFCIAILVVFLVARSPLENVQAWLVPALSLVFGGFVAWMGLAFRLRRFLVVALASAAAGAAIAALGLPLPAAMAMYWMAMGVVMLLSGALALRRYLHAAPVETPGDE
jgi:hypothetical protein